ncbi:hypothetical protein R16034_01918 [Ralstonia edaphis]|uniref:Heme exporter protein D n=1 Tax=Ralstonia edaphi TaxID=3058599 RepID=A0AB72X7D4_9RALS|nr:hypothetical protein [Ralstonia sp. LMG 6871]CAJ0739996.1 hypothetical protein R16034_01918 [Ralstonia sp. LMG 6871]
MNQFSVNHVDYIAGAFIVAAICIAAEMLLLARRWRAANRASHAHPDDGDQ